MNHTQKSYSNHIKEVIMTVNPYGSRKFCCWLSLVAIHHFHVSLGCGDALVCHDALDGSDVCSGSSL